MDNGVHRFSQTVNKGQWRPVGTDRMTRMAFPPATATPSMVCREHGNGHVLTDMNVTPPWNVFRDPHECWPVNGLIMIDAMPWRGEQDE